MERRTGIGVAVAALGFVVLVLVASSGDVQVFHDPPPSARRTPPTGASATVETSPTLPPPAVPRDIPDNAIVAGVAIVLLAVLALLFTYAVATTWFRRLRIRRTAVPPPPADLLALPDLEVADVVLDVDAQLQALAEGTPRNAIVACWLRLEEDVAKAGWPRHPAETSAEFTSRVLASSSLDAGPVNELAALYREARFSRHTMDQDHRDRALAALRMIHTTLGARATAAGTFEQ